MLRTAVDGGSNPARHTSRVDTVGKLEADSQRAAKARVFTDEPGQAALLGECQNAVKAGLLEEQVIVPIGAVTVGLAQGGVSVGDITLLDGTGVGLQDLAVASRARQTCRAREIVLG